MNIKYFFEDSNDSALGKLFRLAYNGRDDIVFVGGSGNLEERCKRHLKSKDAVAIAYLDTIPNNLFTSSVYSSLKQLSIDTDFRCIVIPIVCAEYYYLKSIQHSTVVKDKVAVDLCVSKREYRSSHVVTGHSTNSYKTFERFCKMVCEYSLYHCASIRRNGSLRMGHQYTIADCPCTSKDISCVEPDTDLLDKARKYVSMFPCIPRGADPGRRVATFEEAWEAHRALVCEFNAWAASFSCESQFTLDTIH